jgi:hypothetical protein
MGTLAAGIKEIFATAKTTGSNVMLCGNDGTPDGHMTMANLASVLGGLYLTKGLVENVDANDIKENGFYRIYLNVTHLPEGMNEGFLCVQTSIDGSTLTQFCISSDGTKMYERTYWYGSWGSWQRVSFNIPTFYKDYNSLSELASALGVG